MSVELNEYTGFSFGNIGGQVKKTGKEDFKKCGLKNGENRENYSFQTAAGADNEAEVVCNKEITKLYSKSYPSAVQRLVMGLVVRRRTTGVFYLGVIKPFDKFAHHFLISMPKKVYQK